MYRQDERVISRNFGPIVLLIVAIYAMIPCAPSRRDTPENLRSRTWMLISMYMMGPDIGHWAVYHHDTAPDAMAIRVPMLILTDSGDMISDLDTRLAKRRPDFQFQVFSQ